MRRLPEGNRTLIFRAGKLHITGRLGRSPTRTPTSINNCGEVVGESLVGSGLHAFVYTAGQFLGSELGPSNFIRATGAHQCDRRSMTWARSWRAATMRTLANGAAICSPRLPPVDASTGAGKRRTPKGYVPARLQAVDPAAAY